MDTISVLGQGKMGSPMALQLLKAGYRVSVYNRTRAKCRPAVQAGAVEAGSIGELVAGSDALLLMIGWDSDVHEVVLGAGGVLEAGHAGLLVIDSTTIHPLTSQRMAAAAAQKEIDYLDAPVMSNSEDARRGRLWFQVGGSEAAYRRALPLFEAMGDRHVYLGRSGAGSGAKCGSFPARWWGKRGYIADPDVSYA